MYGDTMLSDSGGRTTSRMLWSYKLGAAQADLTATDYPEILNSRTLGGALR